MHGTTTDLPINKLQIYLLVTKALLYTYYSVKVQTRQMRQCTVRIDVIEFSFFSRA